MKIVNYYRGLPTDTALVSLAEALRQVGQQLIPCFPLGAEAPKGERPPQTAERLRGRMPRWLWNLGQIWYDRLGTRALLSVCRQERPDLIHERYLPFSLGGARAARRFGLPLITIVHEFQAHQMPERFTPLLRREAKRWERAAIHAADRIIVVSGVLRDEVVRKIGYPAARIEVMPNGIHVEHFRGLSEARQRRRAELAPKPGEFLVGYLQSWDGTPLQQSAEGLLRQLIGHLAGNAIRLVLIGGGPQLEAVKRRMTADTHLGCPVQFVGQVAHRDVPEYLAALDVALIPVHEGFTSPLKLFEYMGAGCAVVAPDTPNIREILTRPDLGALFAPGDAVGMAEAVLALMRDPERRRQLGESARNEVLSRYTWRRNAERFAELAEEVLVERRGAQSH